METLRKSKFGNYSIFLPVWPMAFTSVCLPHVMRQLKGVSSRISFEVCSKTYDELWHYQTRNRHFFHKNVHDFTIFFDLLA